MEHGRRWLGLITQALAAIALIAAVAYLAHNTAQNLQARGIPSGFDFLLESAGFDIGEGWLSFSAGAPYWQALVAGLVNTLRVVILAIILTTLMGTALGLGRLSRNYLLARLCGGYVETFRNIPLLLQLLAWYFVLTDLLPSTDEPWLAAGVIALSKSGLSLPGASLTPEFLAVLAGLVFYSAAYFAEIVRAGFNAVSRSQKEAAAALGLTPAQIQLHVVLPQALRFIMPPAANQYLSLIKNSSLAIAVGYPDLVSVANTTLNQTGRAVECVSLIMLVYLGLSLATSLLLRRIERRMAW